MTVSTKKLAAKMLAHSERADIRTWSLDAVEDFQELAGKSILSAATEVLNLAIQDQPSVWFPIEWNFGIEPGDGIGGPPPDDAMTIYITLPLGDLEGAGPTWGFSLRDLVEVLIDGGGLSDPDELKNIVAIRDGLLDLAHKIDGALGEIAARVARRDAP